MASRTIEIPEDDIWKFLFERKDKGFRDDQVIYRYPLTERNYTYASVKKTAAQFGAGLQSNFSIRKGDVVAIFSPNCIDTPAITWGCLWAGGVLSPANPAYTADELALHLTDCSAKLLVTQKKLLPAAIKAAAKAGVPKENIVLIGDERDDGFRHFEQVLGNEDEERTKVVKEDLAFLVYSSGTTGHPKGVMLTHLNIVANLVMLRAVDGKNLTPGRDKILSVLPFYHIYGLSCLIHQPLLLGVESVVMPAFDLNVFCSTIQNHKITYIYVAPPIVLHLAKNPIIDNYNLKSVRMMTSGAAPLTKDLILEVHKRLGLKVKQAYGLSETSPVSHIQPWDDSWKSRIGSVGPAAPGLECRIMSPQGTQVPPGEEGEVWVRGANVFKGYHNNVTATRECLTEDAFFKTGDVGREDSRGNLFITDRVKELIKYKGSQVAPAELEGLLLGHTDVIDVAIIGFYVESIATEVPMAYVVAKDGTPRSERKAREIVEWLAEKTSKTKRLRGGLVWIDAVPKSASGKILRRVLKQMSLEKDASKPMAAVDYSNRANL